MKICHLCKKEVKIDKIIGRKDVCPFCNSELRCCLNCRYYDQGVYNQCRETQADRVLEKDRSTFCDYFIFRESLPDDGTNKSKETARDKLEALFTK